MDGSFTGDYKTYPNTSLADLKHIPGNTGIPVLGVTPGLYRDFYGTIRRHYERYGLTSKVRMGMQTGVLALGPDNAQTILLDRNRNFSSQMGYADIMQAWFGLPVLLRDFDEHRMHRRLFQAAFKAEAMQGYAQEINQVIARALETWQQQDKVRFTPFMRQLLIAISARIFYGIDDIGSDAAKLARAFLMIFDKGMTGLIKQNLPPLKYYYGKKGERYVRDYLGSLIDLRRTNQGTDFMSSFVSEVREDGSWFPDRELIDHLSFLFFAAYDTTSSGLSHLVMYLANDQKIQDRLRAQSLEFGKSMVDFHELSQLTGIEKAFNEALRLHPSVPMYMRRCISACQLEGVIVPANTLLYLVPGFNHRMPDIWTHPERFDPERFGEERQEYKKHSFAFIPFGGGAHKCIGMNMALMNARLFMHQLLIRYRFRLKPGYRPGSQTIPTPRPPGGLPLIIEKI